MTWKPDIFIYHSPCDDGFAAAWAVRERWGSEVELFPTNYGRNPPQVEGKNVLIGDFSYKRETIDVMLGYARSIVILDHHKTAEGELEAFRVQESSPGALCADDVDGILRDLAELDRPPCIALFDMDQSGAMLTWRFCHPGKPTPKLIQYVQDRDLWKFEHEETRAITLWLRSHAYDFVEWTELAAELEDPQTYPAILREAYGIERFYDQKIAEMTREMHWIKIHGSMVPAVNCSWAFASDVAHALLDMVPCPFAACYYDRAEGVRTYSLRSRDERADVSEVAKRYGGGGHRNAAGFEVPLA